MVDGSASNDMRLIAVTQDVGSPHLETWLAQAAKPAPRIWLAIGPEGGWSEGGGPSARRRLDWGHAGGYHSAQFHSGSCRRQCPLLLANAQRLMPSRRKAFISGRPLTCMRRSRLFAH